MENRELVQKFANAMAAEYAKNALTAEQTLAKTVDCLVSMLALSLTNQEMAKETLEKIVLKS